MPSGGVREPFSGKSVLFRGWPGRRIQFGPTSRKSATSAASGRPRPTLSKPISGIFCATAGAAISPATTTANETIGAFVIVFRSGSISDRAPYCIARARCSQIARHKSYGIGARGRAGVAAAGSATGRARLAPAGARDPGHEAPARAASDGRDAVQREARERDDGPACPRHRVRPAREEQLEIAAVVILWTRELHRDRDLAPR